MKDWTGNKQTGMYVFKWWTEEDPDQMEIDFEEARVDI